MKKKLISMAIALLMLLQLIPAVSAAGTVTFTLIGADQQGNYVVWIPETEYAVTKLSKVGSILKTAADEAGLSLTGLETDYISAITAPEALGGYKMAEFTNGAYSGWMYTINGLHPGRSVNNFYLAAGDELVFHYVNDYRYEVEDWSGGDSLGTQEDWNKWLEADDSWLMEDAPEEDKIPTEPEQTPEEELPEQERPEQPPRDVTEIIDAIDSLNVSKANEKTRRKLENIEDAVDDLSDEEQSLVTNLEALTELREDFDELLDEAIDEAKDELDDYADTLERKDFTDKQWDEIDELLEEAEEELEDARDTDEIDDILSDMKKDIRAMTGEEEEVASNVSFADVVQTDWFYDDVRFAVEEGLFNGTSETAFSPNGSMTRAMVVTVLYRLADAPAVSGSSSFSDVQPGQWYTDAVLWATEQGIVTGYSDSVFGTDDAVTRQQLAAILYRYAVKDLYDTSAAADLSAYSDVSMVAGYALRAMQWANATGLIGGRTENTLAPEGTATRAEVAAILHRFAENF